MIAWPVCRNQRSSTQQSIIPKLQWNKNHAAPTLQQHSDTPADFSQLGTKLPDAGDAPTVDGNDDVARLDDGTGIRWQYGRLFVAADECQHNYRRGIASAGRLMERIASPVRQCVQLTRSRFCSGL